MERHELINEVIAFFYTYGIFQEAFDEHELKSIIYHHLDEEAFVENIINVIITKAREREDIDTERLKALLIGLERIRLDLEYTDSSTT